MQGRIFLTLLLLIFSGHAGAKGSDACIAHSDLEKIAQDFDQFERFLGKQSEYCPGDFDEKWFKIAQSLDVLMNIAPNEPDLDQDDALTYQAIQEKDWWDYFTNRAKVFSIENNCPQNVVAYVQPFFGNGRIHLCDIFFTQNVSSQASTMMHEVRHFDGHRHVTCSQGNEKGNGGACDNTITGRGSYAISVQTLVGMARAETTAGADKPLLEAEAVYMAFNKFNQVPQVKMNNSIILSNDRAEVFAWSLDGDLEKIADLPTPSVVLNSANNLTIYPLDTQAEAYRQDNKLNSSLENPGLYAKHYNAETPEERAKYQSISYFATGGLLKQNTLFTLCNRQTNQLAPTSLDGMGQFVSIISRSTDALDQKRESLLLAENGDLFRYSCGNKNSDDVDFVKVSDVLEIPKGQMILDSFGFDGEQYALMDNGQLQLVNMGAGKMTLSPLAFPSVNQDWVSATPISIPEVF